MTTFITANELQATQTGLIGFRYGGKVRIGSIEKIQGGAVTLKHSVQSAERLGRPFAAYTLAKIEGKISIGSM